MNLGRNFDLVRELLDLAKDIAAIDDRYLQYRGPLPDAVKEWKKKAQDLVEKMDN